MFSLFLVQVLFLSPGQQELITPLWVILIVFKQRECLCTVDGVMTVLHASYIRQVNGVKLAEIKCYLRFLPSVRPSVHL